MSWRTGIVLPLTLLLVALLVPAEGLASHDQGYPCYQCHSLKPSELRPGSRAIRLDETVLSSIPTTGADTNLPLPGTGGYPISCDYCHRAANDVPNAKMATKARKHPVDLIQTGDLNPANEITCNDCHGGGAQDLVPSTLLLNDATDGYPDHKGTDNVYAHNLTNNPPKLTLPYWGATLPGVNRSNDTAFWTGVQAGTQDILCWRCHDGVALSPYTQVRSTRVVKSDYTGGGPANGHQIKTSVGGALGVGSALPCYDCHDSHGSVNNALLLDNQSIYGAATSTMAVTNYNQGARPYLDLPVCARCHDTGLAATAAGTRVEGLNPVDPFNSATQAAVHVGSVSDNMLASPKNCLGANGGCHATPHNPVGESKGGQNCAVCHASIYTGMRSNTGYHHVMLADNHVYGSSYPTNAIPGGTSSDRTCLICHVDHNYFSKLVNPNFSRAKNLRRDIALQPDNGANAPVNTDFDNTLANGGVCTSCHANVQTKNSPGTLVKDDGVPSVPVVSKSLYNFGAHSYASTVSAGSGHFSSDNTDSSSQYFLANCSKCHNDTMTKSFQNSPDKFGLHDSTRNNVLAEMGYTTAGDNLAENLCYRCHSKTSDPLVGTRKPVNGRDYYNNAPMDNAAENLYILFNRNSRHPLAQVDCLSCHNVHSTRSATGSVVANPDNTYAYETYVLTDNTQAGKTARSNFCLKCHDATGLTTTVTSTVYVPKTIAAASTLMNKSANGARGHWSVSGSFQATTIQACDACHDKHGSTAKALLGRFDSADGQNKINGVPVYTTATPSMTDNQAICSACHTNAGGNYPSTTVNAANIAAVEGYRDGTGYFSVAGQVSRWPGKATWDNATFSPHNTSAKTAPAALGGRAVGDCNSCHDVHGTPYTYDMLNDNMVAGNYKLCFDCHGRTGSPSGTDNIAQYYPAASQGLGAAASATVHTGHNIKTAGGLLPQYTALPCYDCHVTHGSRNGNTQLKSDQRWSGLGDTRNNAANTRTFCLGCHVAYDDAATGGTVEGLTRQTAGANKLKLPSTNPIVEHGSASTHGCGACHAGRNYNDNTYGPHYPATGLCDLCHEGQGARSAGAIGFNGSHLKHSDNTTYRLACKQCHSWTRPTAPAVHKDNTAATQYAQVAFDNEASNWSTIQYATAIQYEYRSMNINPYGGALLTPTYAGGTDNGTDSKQSSIRWRNGQCSNIWCHSNAMPVGGTNVFDTVNWGGTVTCGIDCHGNDGQSGRARIGDNASVTKGSPVHYKHVAAIGCSNCHYSTVTGANTTITAFDNHVNGVKNVRFAPSIGGTYDNVNRTCSGTSCHGTPAPLPDWDNAATVTNCFSCHQGTEQSYKPQSDKTGPSPVDSTQYTTTGHGRASGNYNRTLNPAASFDNVANDCYYCHSQNATHAPSTDNVNDPYRLGYGADTTGQIAGSARGAWADNTDGLCLKCHGSAADRTGVTFAATLTINEQSHTKAVAGAQIGVWTFTPKCVDCHDPHGDGNDAMIRSGINAPTSATDNGAAGAGSNTKGTPLRTTNISAVTFTDNTGFAANSYAISGGASRGICEVCHNQTTAYSRTLDNTAAHPTTNYCISCHGHTAGFKGLGGPDVGQYFDRKIQAPGPSNYADNSSHPLRGLTDGSSTLLFGGSSVNCLGCHYASGGARTSDECYKCHFENTSGSDPSLSASRHMDRQLQLATVSGNSLPSSQFAIASITDYDNWCLQCHDSGATTTLGGEAVAGNSVVLSTSFANGRHRANGVGCIYCHQPHGRGNSHLIRENADNRRTAGGTPQKFNVFPNDNLNLGGYGSAQNQNYRARQYWADNTLPYRAEADDDQSFCNKTCHLAKISAQYSKDKIIKRDGTTGNYQPNGAPAFRKVFVVNGVEYTIDNVTQYQHQHPNGEIIPTDNMVDWYASLSGLTGPSYYQYPLTTSSHPSAYDPATSDLPFSPDWLGDGVREFTNAYNGLGVRIPYRLTCSTCHDPHGTSVANAPGDDGYPDLRLRRANPSTLCLRCHK